MPTLPHDSVEDLGFVSKQPLLGLRIGAKLQCDRSERLEVGVPGLPHFTEPTDAQQLDKLPIPYASRAVSWLEVGMLVRLWEKGYQVF
jgi:hypothetical protein